MFDDKVNRRGFFKQAAIAGAAISGVGVIAGCSTNTSGSIKWDDEVDVIVVGSGFAGLAAAWEALAAGASVKIIDKMPISGGNSTINGGDFAACGTKMQADAGVKDSVDLLVQDMLKAGMYYNHVDKVRLLAEKSAEAIEWSISMGVPFGKLNFHGGHSVPRSHTTANASGSDIIKALIDKLKGKGVSVINNRKMVRLIDDGKKRITGIETRDKYKLGDENSGNPLFMRAKKAVIMASGGFSQDVKMRMIHEPRLTEKLSSTNHAGATGESLREMLKHEAMDVHMDWIQLGPWTSPDEKGFGFAPQFVERLVGYAPMINPKTGKRFIQETGNRKVRADAILEVGEPVIIFGDSYAVKRQVVPRIFEGGSKNGVFKEYATLEEIAKAYNIPLEPFLASIERWNSMVAKGKDDDFGCLILEGAKPTEQGPFYVCKLWPKVHHTMGGVVTNLKCQVINQDYEPIKGLYAAGEITGGIHGAVRLGSCAILDCIVNGRIAGQEAAKEQPA